MKTAFALFDYSQYIAHRSSCYISFKKIVRCIRRVMFIIAAISIILIILWIELKIFMNVIDFLEREKDGKYNNKTHISLACASFEILMYFYLLFSLINLRLMYQRAHHVLHDFVSLHDFDYKTNYPPTTMRL